MMIMNPLNLVYGDASDKLECYAKIIIMII